MSRFLSSCLFSVFTHEIPLPLPSLYSFTGSYLSVDRPDRVRARFQVTPIAIRADTLLIMDLLDFVSSLDDSKEEKKETKKKVQEDDDVDNTPKFTLDPELSISTLKLILTFDVNSDLHDLMKKLHVVKNRYAFLEPVLVIMNLFGDMIGHIDKAELNLQKYEKRKCVMSTKQIQKSITKHYADEFGSPSKWLAIAKKTGALGAVSVLTGAVDGVFSFGKGIVGTAKTGDVSKLVGGM